MAYIKDGCYYCEAKEKDKDKDKEMCRVMDREKDVYLCVESGDKCRKREPESCCPKHPKPKKILLDCGCNPQDANFEIKKGHIYDDQAFVLDTIKIDNTLLCKPLVKIEFSSIIYFEAEARYDNCCELQADDETHRSIQSDEKDIQIGEKEIEVNLLFELIRSCKCEKECIQSWRYIKAFEIGLLDKLEIEISEPFTVTFCDKCSQECCEYKMVVRGKKFEGEFKALRVGKADLSALAQGQNDD